MLNVQPQFRPQLDGEFLPAVLWNRAFGELVGRDSRARDLTLVLRRSDTPVFVHRSKILSADHALSSLNLRYTERLIKFLLWQIGAPRVQVVGAPEIVPILQKLYSPHGGWAFDYEFMGRRTYGEEFRIEGGATADAVSVPPNRTPIGRHLDGCRIGFDLGGSDRKAVALIDGKVVFSEEIAWSPYFEKDPSYHVEGVNDSIARAAAHLPRVDAIGGSAAGVYVENEPRVASLFRGVPQDLFDAKIRPMFSTLKARWGNVPFEVVNDGEVTALAGSMSLNANAVLGVSMGTSMAGGYVTRDGAITTWLNELAFAPVDYRVDAPRDEWSGDIGCGVQYFSQQGVARLAERAGFSFRLETPLAERLVSVQEAMASGDARAQQIYETLGVYFGYSLAHYAQFYDIEHVLVLGRVTTGKGGEVILRVAEDVLRNEFPELERKMQLHMPNEKEKRNGQAIAAASLPKIPT